MRSLARAGKGGRLWAGAEAQHSRLRGLRGRGGCGTSQTLSGRGAASALPARLDPNV